MKFFVRFTALMLVLFTLSFSQSRTGFFGGLGVGAPVVFANGENIYGLGSSLEVGYGINDNLLVYLHGDVVIAGLAGLYNVGAGASYYINDEIYIKSALFSSVYQLNNLSQPSGLGVNLGVGYNFSSSSSLETSFYAFDFKNNDISSQIDVQYKYRFF